MNPINLQLQIDIINNIEEAEVNANRPRRQFLRNADPLNALSDREFIKLFRLSKELATHLVEILDAFLTPSTRTSSLSKLNRVNGYSMNNLKIYSCTYFVGSNCSKFFCNR